MKLLSPLIVSICLPMLVVAQGETIQKLQREPEAIEQRCGEYFFVRMVEEQQFLVFQLSPQDLPGLIITREYIVPYGETIGVKQEAESHKSPTMENWRTPDDRPGILIRLNKKDYDAAVCLKGLPTVR